MSTTVIVILAIWFIGCFIAWFYIGKKYKNDFNLFFLKFGLQYFGLLQ